MKIIHQLSDEMLAEMRRLWKDTFHDTDEYISIVFDNLADREYCRCCVDDDGRIIAALVGIPYLFNDRNSDITENKFSTINEQRPVESASRRALYLCGLVTIPDFRRRGIMHSLMSDIEQYAVSKGFNYTFLIPADSSLRKYYEKYGYHTSSYNICCSLYCNCKSTITKIINDQCAENFVENRDVIHRNLRNIDNDYILAENQRAVKRNFRREKIDLFKDYLSFSRNSLYSSILENCVEFEMNFNGLYIRHTIKDIDLVIREKFSFGSCLCLVHDQRSYISDSLTPTARKSNSFCASEIDDLCVSDMQINYRRKSGIIDKNHLAFCVIYEPEGVFRPLFGDLVFMPQVIEALFADRIVRPEIINKCHDGYGGVIFNLILPENYPDSDVEEWLKYFASHNTYSSNIKFSRDLVNTNLKCAEEDCQDLKILGCKVEDYGMVKILDHSDKPLRDYKMGFSFMLD